MRQNLIRGVLGWIGPALLATGCTAISDRDSPAPEPPASHPVTSPSPTASPSPAASPSPPPIPKRGPGTFTVAPGGTKRVGTAGTLMRYRVEVEDGIPVTADEFAAAADAILADPRSWTAGGQWSFRRVDHGDVDFVLRLATPNTVDQICAEYWVDTEGKYSCRAGDSVMINLRRWLRAVPHFDGDLETYRQYVINHEVGHRLGHGHVACPQRGGPAPVMMQQTIALEGCLPNGWPYVDGEPLTGSPLD